MHRLQSRREWLIQTTSVVSGAWLAGTSWLHAAVAPTAPVSVARCTTYDTAELLAAMQKMFDQIGGLKTLVNGKTVGIKVNLTGGPEIRVNDQPVGDTHYTHPQVIAATVHLVGKAGARRIRVLESPMSTTGSLEEYMARANWQPRDILGAAANVEFENTNFLGNGKKYSRLVVPNGGLLFPAYDVNHSYEDCDVFVSIAKMKDHVTAGITLSMKNVFGALPCTIYGGNAGVQEPSVLPGPGNRSLVMHVGSRAPSLSSPQETDPASMRIPGFRLPRVVTDLVAARPIHLAVIDGIETMSGSEGPWNAGVARVSSSTSTLAQIQAL